MSPAPRHGRPDERRDRNASGSRLRAGPANPPRALHVPHDAETERLVVGLALGGDLAYARAVAAAHPDCFYAPTNKLLAQAVTELAATGEKFTRAEAVELLTGYTGEPSGDWHGRIRALYGPTGGVPYAGLTGTEPEQWLDTLERLRRRRLMLEEALNLIDVAESGVEWHDAAGRINELANTNGAVSSMSSLEIADVAAIVAGAEPEVEPFWLRRDDGVALLYPGRIHDLHAEPSIGKTFIALAAVREILEAGGAVIYLDYEDTSKTIIDRLKAIGTPEHLLTDDRLRYVNPAGPLEAAERSHLEAMQAELVPELVVIDGVAEALARDGYDEDRNSDVVTWAELVVRPLARRGAAVLLLDHVTKHAEGRARGARGAGAKLGFIDGVSYEVRAAVAFSKSRSGFVKLIVAKDRGGVVGAIGEHVANVHVEPEVAGTTSISVVRPPPPEDFRPAGIMERISRRLEGSAQPAAASWLFNSVRGKRPMLEEALALLLLEGYVTEVDGINGKVYESSVPFREDGRTPVRQEPLMPPPPAGDNVVDAQDRFPLEPPDF